ncbi:MAG: cytochrome c [Azoarcus sp.]|jgi:cytochrome c|nr:cytochrome c [Azoarcus sp.]
MKRMIVLALGLVLAPMALAAPDGATLYRQKTCVACHGKNGDKPLLPTYPKIAGQNAVYAEQQIKDIKSGARSNAQAAAMKAIMHLVSDEEIKALAVYLEALK